MPIVEPEVLMDGDHTIDESYRVTERTLRALFTELFDQRVEREGTLLKTNMVVSGYDSSDRADVDTVAERTIECLANTVPAAVPGVVFLSGGMSDEDATAQAQRDEPARAAPVGAVVLVRASTPGARAEGVGRRLGQRRGGAAGLSTVGRSSTAPPALGSYAPDWEKEEALA